MAKLIKKPQKEGKYLAHGDNGKTYPAEKVNKYMPGGVMFLAIPSDVKILGYSRVDTQKTKTRPATAKPGGSAATLKRIAAARSEATAKPVKKTAKRAAPKKNK